MIYIYICIIRIYDYDNSSGAPLTRFYLRCLYFVGRNYHLKPPSGDTLPIILRDPMQQLVIIGVCPTMMHTSAYTLMCIDHMPYFKKSTYIYIYIIPQTTFCPRMLLRMFCSSRVVFNLSMIYDVSL